MRNIILILLINFIVQSFCSAQSYRERIRQNVISKLRFHFVADPTQPFPADISTLEINKVAIANNQSITGPLWTDSDNVGLKNLLIKILRSEANGGDFNLQKMIYTVSRISNQQVQVFLFADFDNPTFHSSWRVNVPYCRGGTSYVSSHNNASWPCASESPRDIGLGAYFYHSSYSGFTNDEKLGTFIHEFTHTQMPLSTVVYGPDGNHFYQEMVPSRNSAFDEGIANAFEFRYHLPNGLGMTSWFNNNSKLFVENWSGCSGDQCLQTRLSNASVSTQSCPTWITNQIPNSRCYNIRDIPGDILMYSENTIANMLYQFMAQFRGGEILLVRDLRSASAAMSSATYKFGPLFKQLVSRGMNFRHPNAASGTHTHGQHLPLGILDYYSGYKLNSKSTLGNFIGTNWQNTDTNIEDYFSLSNKRNVLLGYRNNATDWNVTRQISRFARHLNVRPAPRAAGTSRSQ